MEAFNLEKWDEGSAELKREREKALEKRWQEIRERIEKVSADPGFLAREIMRPSQPPTEMP